MLILSLVPWAAVCTSSEALAETEPVAETGAELVRVVGLSKDGRYAVLEIHEDVHSNSGTMGITERLVAIDAHSGERRQWLLSAKDAPPDDRSDDAELAALWEKLRALPGKKDYEAWAATVQIQPPSTGETCGQARRYAAVIDVDSEEESPKSSWKGGSFSAEGSGYLVYGVERGGHLWEHAAQHRPRGHWGGGDDLDVAWSADCSRIVWVVRDTTPEMTRDGYSATYKRGRIRSVQILPSGPKVAVVGSAERASAVLSSLAQAGIGATHSEGAELGLEPGPSPVIYAWSKAEGVASEIARALPGATVAPLAIRTGFDVLIVPAR